MEPKPQPKPPWEVELEAEVLAEERARQDSAAKLDSAEAEALRKVEREMQVAEFDALIAARKDELAVLQRKRVGERSLGGAATTIERLTELGAVAHVESRKRHPAWLLGGVILICLLFWLVGYLLSREFESAMNRPSRLMEDAVENRQRMNDAYQEISEQPEVSR